MDAVTFIRCRLYESVLAYGAPLVLFDSDRVDLLGLDGLLREAYEVTNDRIATIMQLLIARGIDMLNFIALDPALPFDGIEACVRLREIPARVAVGTLEPVAI